MQSWVRVTDVAARDGLQNEARPIPTPDKVRLVDALSATGVEEVEVSSFVSAKWIPQLADAAEVFAAMTPREGVTYSALVPNQRGLEGALAVRQATREKHGRAIPDKLSVFTAASQTFAQKNTGASIEQAIERFAPIAAACREQGIPLRAYISCVIACPFEGPISPAAVARVARLLRDMATAHGVATEIDLGDTIGAGTPESVGALLDHLWEEIPSLGPDTPATALPNLTLHLHDTFGAASACAERAMDMGVRSFDASAGGLGGCPYASTPGKRAPGNLSTANLLAAIGRRGLKCGIQPARLDAASAIAAAMVDRQDDGQAGERGARP